MRNTDPYYLGNDENLPVRLTLQSQYKTVSCEDPWDASVRDVLESLYGAMTTLGYSAHGVLEEMYIFAMGHLDKDTIEEIDNNLKV